MTTVEALSGIERDAEGFFVHPQRWTEDMVPALAAESDLDLSPAHWQVIRYMRAQYDAKGAGPNVRALSKGSGLSIKELYRLFPRGPAKTAARLAGIPKPRGCI
jgi:TusE/DsrC/DsvC family sulfur relay protein